MLPRECVEEREHVEGYITDIWRDTEIGVVGAGEVAESIGSPTLPTLSKFQPNLPHDAELIASPKAQPQGAMPEDGSYLGL